jgi:tRNA A37 threonylcarbamoyladenosine dehydratase
VESLQAGTHLPSAGSQQAAKRHGGVFSYGDKMERFSRTKLLIGQAGLATLASAHVMVFGVGGVGSACVEALARSGIGELTLVDFDRVAPSNINRQLVATEDTLGELKIQAMAKRLRLINPEIVLNLVPERYTAENSEDFFLRNPTYIVDAIDSVPNKVDLLARAYELKYPIVSAMGAGNRMDPTKFQIADLSQTHTCPLAKIVRRELRDRGIQRGIRVVFSLERPLCHGQVGTIGFVPPAMGMILASVVVRDLLGELS